MRRRTLRESGKLAESRAGLHHLAKKSLGQNFLIDGNISRKIVESLSISDSDNILEIGPGKGALTRLLAARGASVTAVEKDSHLFDSLRDEFGDYSNLHLVHGDFLSYKFPSTATPTKVVGNIPYNLTSQIVSTLVDQRKGISCAVLMVQDEVACRLSADAGTKEYGAISIRLQLVSDVQRLFSVSPTCFKPRPRVNSRVIKVVFRNTEPLSREEDFVAFVKRAFGMRRKMFRHFVSHFYGKESLDLVPERFKTNRVETFTPEEIYGLFSILEKNAGSDKA